MTSPPESNKKLAAKIASLRDQLKSLKKGWNSDRKELEVELNQALEKFHKSIESTIRTLEETVKLKDPYTANHQRRVAELSRAIAEKMNLSGDEVYGVFLSASLHDIGKIAIPSELFTKGEKLNQYEYLIIKSHPEFGYKILKNLEFPWPIENIAYKHHERLDGSGYPNGIKGDKIELETRIISVADVIEAMISYRPFRPPLGVEAALEEIESNKGLLYDPQVVEACLELFKKGFEFEEGMIKKE